MTTITCKKCGITTVSYRGTTMINMQMWDSHNNDEENWICVNCFKKLKVKTKELEDELKKQKEELEIERQHAKNLDNHYQKIIQQLKEEIQGNQKKNAQIEKWVK